MLKIELVFMNEDLLYDESGSPQAPYLQIYKDLNIYIRFGTVF